MESKNKIDEDKVPLSKVNRKYRTGMRAVIYDEGEHIKNVLYGEFDRGLFYYKFGGIDIPIIKKLTEKEEKLPCDYEITKFMPDGKNSKNQIRTAAYRFNGKDYIQISLLGAEITKTEGLADYHRMNTIFDYAEKAALTKPQQSLKDILQWMLIIALIIANAITIYNDNAQVHSFNQIDKPFGIIANSTVKNQHFLANTTSVCIEDMNKTIQLLTQSGSVVK